MKTVETTSTSNKVLALAIAAIFLTGFGLSSHGSGSGSDSILGSGSLDTNYGGLEGYGVPSYDTQGEFVTQLVAPFLLIALLLQLGLQIALESTLLRGLSYQQRKGKKKKIRRHSILMSLAIAGMIIPSPIFRYIHEYVAILYGGITWLFLFVVILVFGMIIWGGLANSEPRGE